MGARSSSRKGKIGNFSRRRLDKIIENATGDVGVGSTNPGGSDNQIQFNNGGAFGAVTPFTFEDTDLKIADDTKLIFGTNSDAHIEYNENGDDFLIISGSTKGMVLSGSTVQIRGTLEGASPLKIAGGIEIVPASDGTTTSMKFGDDIKLFFGDDSDSFIVYNSASDNYLELSGSGNGVVISGSNVYIDQKLGIGMSVGSVTHGITLPDVADNSGKIKANAYMTYSSQRFKKDVEVIDNPIETIQNLRGVTFTWKKNNQKDYGFIAEEVGRELPIIVEWDRNNSENSPQAMSMDYTRIIPILLEGIKFQQNQIDNLIDEIKCLKQGTEQN